MSAMWIVGNVEDAKKRFRHVPQRRKESILAGWMIANKIVATNSDAIPSQFMVLVEVLSVHPVKVMDKVDAMMRDLARMTGMEMVDQAEAVAAKEALRKKLGSG